MVRAGIILVLFFTVFAMMRGISDTWRQELPTMPVKAEKNVKQVEPLPAQVELQPVAPAVLPELKSGYLFNEERTLESEADKAAQLLESPGNDLGISADMAQLTYSGSIIGDTFSIALVNFPPGKDAAQSARGRRQTSAKRSTNETAQLKVGDVLSGYLVEEISPEKILLKKGDEVLEKFLYDSSKKREAPVRRAKAPAAAASGTPARPAPAPASAATPLPARATTATSEEGSTQVTPTRTSTRTTQRRMVVSRKPPPKPDTSRVSRRGRTSVPSITTPPMPVLHK